jgi:8-oxo-dGTP diphosphatase
MRPRPSARLLVINAEGRVLLFRFAHDQGPLKGQSWWATPGGGLDPGETFEQGAIRELKEETGLEVESVGPEICRRSFPMEMPDGEWVVAEECFFRIDISELQLVDTGWTDLERRVMTEHRWWSREELAAAQERVFPENLVELLDLTGSTSPEAASVGPA